MARPSDAPDGWWLAVAWVTDDDGVVSFRDVAPAAGPPPDPPLGRLGPAVSGALSGLILEDDGKLQMRLGLIAPPDDPAGRGASRWRSGWPSGSSLPGRWRCARTSWRRRSSPGSSGQSKASAGPDRTGRVDSLSHARPIRRLHGGTPQTRSGSARRGPRSRRGRGTATPGDDGRRRRRRRRRRRIRRPTPTLSRPRTPTSIPTRSRATTRPTTPTPSPDPDRWTTRGVAAAGDHRTRPRRPQRRWSRQGCADRPADRALRHRGRGHRHLPAVQRRHRPVDRCAVVPQRRFRLRLLDPGGRDGRSRRRRHSSSRPSVFLGNLWLAGRLAPPPSADGAGSLRSLVDRINEAAQAADDRRGGPRSGVRRRPRPVRQQPGHHLRSRGHARSHAARRLGPRRDRPVRRAPHRRGDVGGVGDGPALPQPRPVLADRERHRSDLRPRHQLLPVRAAVPAAHPGPVQRHRHRSPWS